MVTVNLKKRGVICFLALLLGCCSIVYSDEYLYFRSYDVKFSKFAQVWDWSINSWVDMQIIMAIPSGSVFQYRYRSGFVANPVIIRSNHYSGNLYCFSTYLSPGYTGVNEGLDGSVRQYIIQSNGSWGSNKAATRINLSSNYVPPYTPYVPDLGFSNYIDVFIPFLGSLIGSFVGGVFLFFGFRKAFKFFR